MAPAPINHRPGCTARDSDKRSYDVDDLERDCRWSVEECTRCGRRSIERIDLALVRGPQPRGPRRGSWPRDEPEGA